MQGKCYNSQPTDMQHATFCVPQNQSMNLGNNTGWEEEILLGKVSSLDRQWGAGNFIVSLPISQRNFIELNHKMGTVQIKPMINQ